MASTYTGQRGCEVLYHRQSLRVVPEFDARVKNNDCGLVVRFFCYGESLQSVIEKMRQANTGQCDSALRHLPCGRLVSVVEIVRSFITTNWGGISGLLCS